MAQPWPGKANAVAGNFYQLPDGKVRFYAGGDEFRIYGVDNQGNERIALDGLMSQLGQSLSGLMPKGGPRPIALRVDDFGGMPQDVGNQVLRQAITRKAMGLDQPAVVDKSAMPADVGSRAIQQSIFDNAFKAYRNNQPLPVTESEVEPLISNEPDARASEMERMRQQYGAGASFWNTDEGKDLLLDTMSNEYTGDQAGLPGFYQDQVKAGLGQMDMIKKGLGYEEGSAMAEWADNNPALALREYNKRQPDSYSGTGPSDSEIEQAMKDGNFFPSEGSPNPLGKTGKARESNTAQTAEAQNLSQIKRYRATAIPGMGGKEMLSRNMINLLRRQGRL